MLGVTFGVAVIYLFVTNVILPMAASAGLMQGPPPPLPRPINSRKDQEGTPLLPRGSAPGGRRPQGAR